MNKALLSVILLSSISCGSYKTIPLCIQRPEHRFAKCFDMIPDLVSYNCKNRNEEWEIRLDDEELSRNNADGMTITEFKLFIFSTRKWQPCHIILHEFGHAIGLEHESGNGIMEPFPEFILKDQDAVSLLYDAINRQNIK